MKYLVFNYTDKEYASTDLFTKAGAESFIKNHQGQNLKAIADDFNPFTGGKYERETNFAKGGTAISYLLPKEKDQVENAIKQYPKIANWINTYADGKGYDVMAKYRKFLKEKNQLDVDVNEGIKSAIKRAKDLGYELENISSSFGSKVFLKTPKAVLMYGDVFQYQWNNNGFKMEEGGKATTVSGYPKEVIENKFRDISQIKWKHRHPENWKTYYDIWEQLTVSGRNNWLKGADYDLKKRNTTIIDKEEADKIVNTDYRNADLTLLTKPQVVAWVIFTTYAPGPKDIKKWNTTTTTTTTTTTKFMSGGKLEIIQEAELEQIQLETEAEILKGEDESVLDWVLKQHGYTMADYENSVERLGMLPFAEGGKVDTIQEDAVVGGKYWYKGISGSTGRSKWMEVRVVKKGDYVSIESIETIPGMSISLFGSEIIHTELLKTKAPGHIRSSQYHLDEGGAVWEIILKAPAKPMKAESTTPYRWVLKVVADKKSLLIAQQQFKSGNWGHAGQWYVESLKEGHSDGIYIDAGQGWGVNGLNGAMEEVESILDETMSDGGLVGKRIKLVSMVDPHPIESGTMGTIKFIDGIGQIHVDWDNGSSLAVIPGEDKYEILNTYSGGGVVIGTLAALKRKLVIGQPITMVDFHGQTTENTPPEKRNKILGVPRYVVKVQTNGVYFSPDKDAKTGSYWEFPPASLIEVTDKGFKVFGVGSRELNAKEKEIIANEPKDPKQDEIDMMSDGSTMYYRRKSYYEKSGYGYLYNSGTERGLHFNRNKNVVDDNSIRGEVELGYEFESEKPEVSIIEARVKLLKKMYDKDPSVLLKTRIKMLEKRLSLSSSSSFWSGGELKKGIEVEKEHTGTLKMLYDRKITPEQATEYIAKDHLKESKTYYTELEKMESRFFSGGKIITSARITKQPQSIDDDMPKVFVTIDGKEEYLFEYYPDELTFTAEEFVGLTTDQARHLKFEKDKIYLQSDDSYADGGGVPNDEEDQDTKNYNFALEVFKEEEGRDANMNDPKDMNAIAMLQVGIKHARIKRYATGGKPGDDDEVLRFADMYMQEGTHDKEYHLQIAKNGDGYIVKAQWGRRGAHLTEDVKILTSSWEAATEVFVKVKKEKLKKGYIEKSGGGSGGEPKFVLGQYVLLDDIPFLMKITNSSPNKKGEWEYKLAYVSNNQEMVEWYPEENLFDALSIKNLPFKVGDYLLNSEKETLKVFDYGYNKVYLKRNNENADFYLGTTVLEKLDDGTWVKIPSIEFKVGDYFRINPSTLKFKIIKIDQIDRIVDYESEDEDGVIQQVSIAKAIDNYNKGSWIIVQHYPKPTPPEEEDYFEVLENGIWVKMTK